jgi:hypothetical protein
LIERLIADQRDLNLLVRFLQNQKLPCVVKITDGRPRSYEQNRLMWMWASEAATQRQGMTAREVQSEWKLIFGTPALCAENDGFAAAWANIDRKLTYEEKLELMNYFSVTSLMTSKQLSSFLDEVYRYNVERGIELTRPDDLELAGTPVRK